MTFAKNFCSKSAEVIYNERVVARRDRVILLSRRNLYVAFDYRVRVNLKLCFGE